MQINRELATILCKLSDDDMFELLSRSNYAFKRDHIKFVKALADGYNVAIGGRVCVTFYFDEEPSQYTIIKPKRYCNGIELDDCLTDYDPDIVIYYIVDFYADEGYDKFHSNALTQRFFDRGVVYDNKDSAIKHYKAILNVEVK
jgi:hypothetical protein